MQKLLLTIFGLLSGAAPIYAQSDSPATDVATRKSTVSVQHLSVASRFGFDATVKQFEAQLGVFDPASVQPLPTTSPDELQRVRTKIEGMAGTSGLMRFGRVEEHGALLPLVGQPAGHAVQYVIGNPLVAVEMTQHHLGAGLYAPLRAIIYEDAQGVTRLEYDLPSSLFGQFSHAKIDKVAAGLDQEMAALVKQASGR